MADPTMNFSVDVCHVLLNSRKASTHVSYASKWKRFSAFLSSQGISLSHSSMATVLHFLIGLRTLELSHSSVSVYLAAISTYHPRVDGFTVLSHPLVKRFLQEALAPLPLGSTTSPGMQPAIGSVSFDKAFLRTNGIL